MFGNLGANYLVEAPVSLTEQSGSDKVQTPFKRLMRRTRLLTHPSGSSVKQGGRGNRERKRKAQPQRFPYERSPRRFFGFFLIAQKETRRRSGETSSNAAKTRQRADEDIRPYGIKKNGRAGKRRAAVWGRPYGTERMQRPGRLTSAPTKGGKYDPQAAAQCAPP